MPAGIKANSDGSAAIQVGGTDVITLTSGGAATFVTSPTTVQAGTAAAPSITFSGDTNTGIYSPGADQVAIATGGTAAVTVNSSQQLSFGSTTNPWSSIYARAMYIEAGSGKPGAVAVGTANWTGGRAIWLTNNAYTSSAGTWRYVSSGGSQVGLLQLGNDSLTFSGAASGTADTDITFTQIFDVARGETFALQGATRQTGTGITFPATQSASSNANTLDDYEEGDWTPSVGGNATYTDRYGRYTKIGNIVTCQFFINVNTLGTGSTTNLLGFPFTSANIGYVQTGCVSYYASLAVNTIFVSLYVQPNATNCLFVGKAASGATVDNGIGLFGNNTAIYGTVTYRVA